MTPMSALMIPMSLLQYRYKPDFGWEFILVKSLHLCITFAIKTIFYLISKR